MFGVGEAGAVVKVIGKIEADGMLLCGIRAGEFDIAVDRLAGKGHGAIKPADLFGSGVSGDRKAINAI